MTLQNISRADFCDVVSVLPRSPTNNGKQNIFDAVRKKLIDREKSRSPFWLFVIVAEPATLKSGCL